jgi:hypothetical protein
MTYEEQTEAAARLRKEGWFLCEPSQSRVATVKTLKAAVTLQPADTKDVEYSAFIDWVTDNVILKTYNLKGRYGFACAVTQGAAADWADGSTSDAKFMDDIAKQWAALRDAHDDPSAVYAAKRDESDAAENAKKVRST